MSEQIPPPGAERDAEIARLLGWDHRHDFGEHTYFAWCGDYWCKWCGHSDNREDEHPTRCPGPSWSTDPAACDRLVEEMVRRRKRVETITALAPNDREILHAARVACRESCLCYHPLGQGRDRCDAVSAAALRALRGGA